ncbi:MAG: alpha/beta hydrolase [Rhodospirillales bacterium]
MGTDTVDFTVEDVDILTSGDREMMLRLFKPAGGRSTKSLGGAVLDLHGGVWNNGSREGCTARDTYLAGAGILAASLEYRHADEGYPTSLIDINYAVRWLKANARDLDIDPRCIGICGQSSGGHLAMLAAMRPFDPRYALLPLRDDAPDIDATVACVGMAWPVINPLSRYRHALRIRKTDPSAAWVKDIPECHDRYWKTETAMAEGNPVLALEAGEPVQTPPTLWIQGQPDPQHDYRDPDSPLDLNEPERFVQDYRQAGGEIEILHIEQARKETPDSYGPFAAFFRKHLMA